MLLLRFDADNYNNCTSMAGPGNCLFIVMMDLTLPSAATQ